MNYNISDFSGGMSQDDSFLGKGQCIYSHGIDTVKYPSELRLMPAIAELAQDNEEITSIFSPEAGRVWYGTGDGWVRNSTNGAGIIQVTNPRDISDGCLFNGKFYIFTNRYVYETTYTAGALSAISTLYDPGTAEGYHHPVIYAGNEMYFPSGKVVKYVDEFGNLNTLPQTFSTNVRALSISGSTLRIYTETTLAILDVGTKTVSYSQVLPFVTNGVKTDGNVDYVTTDGDEMYICSGLEWSRLAERADSEQMAAYLNSPKFTFKSSELYTSIATANGRVYTLDRITDRLCIYGKKMQGLPNAFSYGPIHDDSSIGATIYPISNFSAVYATNNTIYVGYRANSFYKIGSINEVSSIVSAYEGIYITPPTDLGDFSIIKSIEEIRVGKTGTTGQLWCSTDGGAFELVGDLDQTEIEQKFIDFKRDFREISFMVKLYNGTDIVKNINLRYNQRQV